MARQFRELSDRRPGLPPPQFSVLSLLLLTTSVAGIIVLGLRVGPIAALVCVLALLSLVAHVAGAALGEQLRGRRGEYTADPDNGEGVRIRQPTQAQPSDFAQTTQLSRKKALHRRPIAWSIGLGAGLASILGAAILSFVMWDDLSIPNVMFGSFSSAVIGGMIGFWIGSLYQVARSALAEAQEKT